ncbi:MAG: hypothetical protein ACLTT1_11330 [[Clostridium] scindens]
MNIGEKLKALRVVIHDLEKMIADKLKENLIIDISDKNTLLDMKVGRVLHNADICSLALCKGDRCN